jgi:MarR family 2-MHQ and catechol resistance regulon transcriptional repressor
MTTEKKRVRKSGRAGLTAQRYRQEFPWADALAMQISLMVFDVAGEQSAALTRLFQGLDHGRTRGRYTALRIIYFANDRLTQNDIRDEMNVTAANVTYLIDGLEKEGLVRRITNPSDRRATFVELTDKGRSVCDVLVPAMARFMGEMSRGFSEAEKKTFLEFLERFNANALASYQQEK